MSVFDPTGSRRLGALASLPDLFARLDRATGVDEVASLALDALAASLHTERVAVVLPGTTEPAVRARGLDPHARRAVETGFDVGEDGTRLVPDLEHVPEPALADAALIADRVRAIAGFAIAHGGRSFGRLVAAWERPRDFADSECAAAFAIAHATGAAIARCTRTPPADDAVDDEDAEADRVTTARAEVERAHARALLLVEATRVLHASLDVASGMAELARLTVPVLADGCVIDLVAGDGAIQRVAAAHVDAGKEALLRELLRDRLGAESGGDSGPEALDPPRSVLHAYLPQPEQVRLIRDIGSVIVIPLIARGRTLGMLTCFRTLSGAYGPEDLEFARELARRTASALEGSQLYQREREANRLKDEFLATLSHELRTPLNVMLGWAHLLRSGQLDDAKTARAIEIIERNAQLQSRIVGDILDFSRITAGHLRLHVCRVELDAVLADVVEAMRPVAEAAGTRVDVSIEAGLTVFGDPARLAQVARALLSNAVKFSDRGGHVTLDARRDGERVRIVVRDQGIGVAPEVLPHLFDRFRQAETGIGRRRGGLGLSLAIARHLVDLHGGRLVADSEGEGRGASFTVSLPVRSAAASGIERTGSGPAHPGSPVDPDAVLNLRIVAVDDEGDVRHLLEALLEHRGARVWTAGSVSEALALVLQVLPDVVLVDIGMAGEDGYSLMRKLRARPPEEGGRIPAIALTAFARDEDRRRAIEAGCQLHVAKPVEPDLLLRAIAEVVERDRSARGAPIAPAGTSRRG